MTSEFPDRRRGGSMLGRIGLSWLLACALGANSAYAADRAVVDELKRLDSRVLDVESRLDRLGREYGDRRGLIGVEEAVIRYEDAVYFFLVGEYERAAMAFFTLVESDALTAPALAQDSEWYLAECLFELENWGTALESYGLVVESGPKHPFFAEAVRRQLEVYGILRDTEGFYRVYEKWILSGKVPATDSVKYTVAKSFYRQGQTARGKAMFSELPASSPYYGRSRYFLGTILAAEGEVESAVEQFKLVLSVQATEQPEVVELAMLALGRLYYELGDYINATEKYQSIPSGSDYFADQLYELVWTFIKQERWGDALRHVEIFLIAFPEHQYAVQMKLTQGHLHMKNVEYEKALAAYEVVVRDYTPLRERLAELEHSREDPESFFARLVEGEDAFMGANYDLPPYAVQMLIEDQRVARAVEVRRELESQHGDVAAAESIIAEVSAALSGSNDSIGTFARGRGGLARVRDDALLLRSQLIDNEMTYLQLSTPEGVQSRVAALRTEAGVLLTRSQDVQGLETNRADRYQVHEEQVREVQHVAFKVDQAARGLSAEVQAARRVFDEKRNGLSPVDAAMVERGLDGIEKELQQVSLDLERLQSAVTRRTVMAAVQQGRAQDTAGQRALLAEDYDKLHRKLREFRGSALDGDAPETFSNIDQMWARVVQSDGRAVETLALLEVTEKKELVVLQQRLKEEAAGVSGVSSRLGVASADAGVLATDIARAGFGQLGDQLTDTIMRADMGVVDVYWLRKTEVSDEITRLATERAERLSELDSRFKLIRQKMED